MKELRTAKRLKEKVWDFKGKIRWNGTVTTWKILSAHLQLCIQAFWANIFKDREVGSTEVTEVPDVMFRWASIYWLPISINWTGFGDLFFVQKHSSEMCFQRGSLKQSDSVKICNFVGVWFCKNFTSHKSQVTSFLKILYKSIGIWLDSSR